MNYLILLCRPGTKPFITTAVVPKVATAFFTGPIHLNKYLKRYIQNCANITSGI